jgi:hypothetical protein
MSTRAERGVAERMTDRARGVVFKHLPDLDAAAARFWGPGFRYELGSDDRLYLRHKQGLHVESQPLFGRSPREHVRERIERFAGEHRKGLERAVSALESLREDKDGAL